jgi:propionate CoA-transferase
MRATARLSTAEEAIAEIADGATVAVSGFVGAGHPELLTSALEQRFLNTAAPCDLTLVYAAGQGDRGQRGLNHLAHEGLLKRVVGGHWNLAPRLGTLALENRIEAYNLPQGVISVLFREIAAGRPGVFTKVGLDTFIDPQNGGGRLNDCTTDDLVERVEIDGESWLRYRSFPIDVALIRATSADARGNLTVEREGLIGEILPIAQAAKNSGGIVIAQVERIVDRIEDPKAVRVPGLLVDHVVVADCRTEMASIHDQTFGESFSESFVTGAAAPDSNRDVPEFSIAEFNERKIIARRALEEIPKGAIVNLGIGLPETVAAVAAETGRIDDFTLTVEAGPIGGAPASGLNFGCSRFPEAIIDQPAQFDFYDGGGIDVAILGAVEIDAEGSVNVSQFGDRFAGVGGFVNIAQSAKRVIFCCPFRVGGLQIDVDDTGNLRIVSEGRYTKFVERVAQVCFHGPSAIGRGQEVLYLTERAVFRLADAGLQLIEVAPGIDIATQILGQMAFMPSPTVVAPKTIDPQFFQH